MFSYENSFAKLMKEAQVKLLSKKNYQEGFKIFQKNVFEMPPVDLYCLKVSKWFNNFTRAYDFLENENIIVNDYKISKTNIYNTYEIIVKDLREHVINIASYHDLLLHLLNEVYQITDNSKNLSWDLVKQGIDEDKVKQQMTKIYSLMKKEISYRNAVLHDMNFLWIDDYLTIEVNQICGMLPIEDNELQELIEPLKAPLRIHLQKIINNIKVDETKRFNNIKKETEKLFDLLCVPYKNKINALMI